MWYAGLSPNADSRSRKLELYKNGRAHPTSSSHQVRGAIGDGYERFTTFRSNLALRTNQPDVTGSYGSDPFRYVRRGPARALAPIVASTGPCTVTFGLTKINESNIGFCRSIRTERFETCMIAWRAADSRSAPRSSPSRRT